MPIDTFGPAIEALTRKSEDFCSRYELRSAAALSELTTLLIQARGDALREVLGPALREVEAVAKRTEDVERALKVVDALHPGPSDG